METTMRPSCVNDINEIRRKLWQSTYSEYGSIDMLKCYINTEINRYSNSTLGRDIVQEISFDINSMQVELVLTDIVSNVVLNTILSEAFYNYIDWAYGKGLLTIDEYSMCKSRTTMLFNLMLNTESKIVIKL